MGSNADARQPGWGCYTELIAANQQLKSDVSSVVAVLPLWNALDCYYDQISADALDDLKQDQSGTLDNRHTTQCGAAVHTYALLDLLNRAKLDGLQANLDVMASHFDEVCQMQDLDALKQCISQSSGATLI